MTHSASESDRPTASQITDDQLDRLYRELDEKREILESVDEAAGWLPDAWAADIREAMRGPSSQ